MSNIAAFCSFLRSIYQYAGGTYRRKYGTHRVVIDFTPRSLSLCSYFISTRCVVRVPRRRPTAGGMKPFIAWLCKRLVPAYVYKQCRRTRKLDTTYRFLLSFWYCTGRQKVFNLNKRSCTSTPKNKKIIYEIV